MGFVAHWAAVALHFVLNANCSVLLQLQLNESNGTFPFKPTVLALYIELLKLGVTLGLLVLEEGGFSSILPKLRKSKGVMRYLVPAVLYSVVNNGGVLAMLYLQPLEAMMLGQLRVVFTVLLSRWILKLQFGWVQWASLLLLISGSVQLQGVGCYHPSADDAGSKLQPGPHDDTQILGIGIMCIVCLSSAAACVYTQALLATDESINIANIKMYGFGVLVNLIAYTFDTSNIGEATDGSLTFYGVAYIINLTFVGIAISRILKHAGAIVKLFSYRVRQCWSTSTASISASRSGPRRQRRFSQPSASSQASSSSRYPPRHRGRGPGPAPEAQAQRWNRRWNRVQTLEPSRPRPTLIGSLSRSPARTSTSTCPNRSQQRLHRADCDR